MRTWDELIAAKAPMCDHCRSIPVDTSDEDHKLPCGCLLCPVCLDRGRGEPRAHEEFCRSVRITRRVMRVEEMD